MKIDHEHVRELHAKGLSTGIIKLRTGASKESIRRIINPEISEKENVRKRVRRAEKKELNGLSSNGKALA